jgi:hypothetical protein
MNLLHYEKEIWASKYKEIAPVLLGLLTSKDCLVVLTHGKAPYRVIFGVPHQAAVGTPIICEKSNNGKGRASDENAASFALVAFSLLKDHDIPCKLVIAAHPTNTDPNKDVNSDYCKEVFREPAELLFECHGAKSQRKLDLELSAGQNALSDRKAFGEFVASTLKNQY